MAKTIYCSFCGRSNHEAGPMMETGDKADARNTIRICQECAKMAIDVIDQEKQRLARGGN